MSKSIEIFILAGGKSSRMGEEKGLVLFDGKPLISYILENASTLGYQINIIGHHEKYGEFGVKVIPDLIPGKGPMGGLFTALRSTTKDNALIISCDIPFISAEVLEHLIQAILADTITVSTYKRKIHPLVGIYPRSLLTKLETNIQEGKLKMIGLIEESPHSLVEMEKKFGSNRRDFYNINSKNDLKEMETTNTKISILAFGVIAEKLGDKILTLPQTEDTDQLKKELVSSYPELDNLKFTISVNKKLATANTAISPNDEIALLPPFSGG